MYVSIYIHISIYIYIYIYILDICIRKQYVRQCTLLKCQTHSCHSVGTPPQQHRTALETEGQTDGCFSKLPFNCHLPDVASVGDWLKNCPWVASRVVVHLHERIRLLAYEHFLQHRSFTYFRSARFGTDRLASGQIGPPQDRQARLGTDRPALGQTGPPWDRQARLVTVWNPPDADRTVGDLIWKRIQF